MIVAAVVLVVAGVVAAVALASGDDESADDDNGSGGSERSSTASSGSVEDFCDAYDSLFMSMFELDPSASEEEQSEAAVEAFQDWADGMEDVGPPEDMPEEAREGYDLVVEKADELEPGDVTGLQDLDRMFSDEEQAAAEAFSAYALEKCGFPGDVPGDLPSDFPTELPSDFPTELPSDFPTELPSNFPTELPSDFPTDFLTEIPSEYLTLLPSDFPTPQ